MYCTNVRYMMSQLDGLNEEQSQSSYTETSCVDGSYR